MPDSVSDPDPTKDHDPMQSEAAQQGASEETELTDEQLEMAAGGSTKERKQGGDCDDAKDCGR